MVHESCTKISLKTIIVIVILYILYAEMNVSDDATEPLCPKEALDLLYEGLMNGRL